MKTKLKDNERLIKEGSANYFNSQFGLGILGNSAGGKLYLTNERMLFEGHGFNVGREAVIIYVKNMVNCTTGFPNTITVLTEDNMEYKFAVKGKSDWCSEINALI